MSRADPYFKQRERTSRSLSQNSTVYVEVEIERVYPHPVMYSCDTLVDFDYLYAFAWMELSFILMSMPCLIVGKQFCIKCRDIADASLAKLI